MRAYGLFVFLVLILLSLAADAKGPRKVAVKINENLEINGMVFRGPDYEFYQDRNGTGLSTLAKGTLDKAQEVQGLWLRAGSVVNFYENYSGSRIQFPDKEVIAGVTLAPNKDISFEYYPPPEKITEGIAWGTVIHGEVGEDTDLATWGLMPGDKPVRERIELRKRDGVSYWCVEKPCRENSRVSLVSVWTLGSERFIDPWGFQKGDTVFIDAHGLLTFFNLKTEQKIGDYTIRGDVELYKNGKLKAFHSLDERIHGIEVDTAAGGRTHLHKNGSIAQLNTNFRDQILGDIVIHGWSIVQFWTSEPSHFLGALKMVTVARETKIPGVSTVFAPRSRLYFDKDRKLREASVAIHKDGQVKENARRLIFNGKGEVIEEKDSEQAFVPNIPGWEEDTE